MANEKFVFTYNVELKKEFLEHYAPEYNKTHARALMVKVEQALGKDALLAGVDEAKEAIISVGLYTKDDIYTLFRYMKRYVELGHEKGQCNKFENGFYVLSSKDISIDKQVLDTFVVGPKQLQDKIKSIQNTEANYSIPAAVMIWSGVYEPHLVKETDIDYEQHTVCGVPIQDEFWYIIQTYNDHCNIGPRGYFESAITQSENRTFLKSFARNASRPEINLAALKKFLRVTFQEKKYYLDNLYLSGALFRAATESWDDDKIKQEIVIKSKCRPLMTLEDFKNVLNTYKKHVE